MIVVIHHNSECGTSRNVLKIIRDFGLSPIIIEYLKTGWTKGQLQGLFAVAGLTPRTALRTSKSPAEELGLTDPSIPDEVILNAMLNHPILVNRPIVCTSKGVELCRPSEAVFNLLDIRSGQPYRTEDGELHMVP